MSDQLIYNVSACMPFQEVTDWAQKYGWMAVYTDKKKQKEYQKWLKINHHKGTS